MTGILGFGERIDGYPVRVLNERAVRASAGLLFFFAITSFMNAWLVGNFQPTRVFVVAFLVDFTIRLFVNPRYAPSLIAGQWFVRKQQPEYVGAAQKRFAWAIGLGLALVMLYLMVLNNVIGPINLAVCGACLILMFFESAFGICIGCKLYNLFNRDKAQLCPGGVCEVAPVRGARGSLAQGAIVAGFAGLMFVLSPWVAGGKPPPAAWQAEAALTQPTGSAAAEAERCKVPEFAKAIGHEAKWKLHNNCK